MFLPVSQRDMAQSITRRDALCEGGLGIEISDKDAIMELTERPLVLPCKRSFAERSDVMLYREDRSGQQISQLGYGCMRFTRKGGSIDFEKAEREVLRAVEGGVNYLDTAYIYPGSEECVGKIVEKNHLRSRVKIATKLPQYLMRTPAAIDRVFQEELRREAEELAAREERLRRESLRAEEALGNLEEEVKEKEALLPGEPGEEVRRELQAVRREMEELQRVLDQEALHTYAGKRLEELRQQEREAAARLEEYQGRLGELDKFSAFRAGFLEESVNALFREVRFRLFREKVGGGLEDRCDVTVEGVPYINVNNGGRIRAGMDIIRAMSELWGVRLPLFIDNAEGVTRLPETACQRIALRVAPGPLRAKREEEGVWQAGPFSRYM